MTLTNLFPKCEIHPWIDTKGGSEYCDNGKTGCWHHTKFLSVIHGNVLVCHAHQRLIMRKYYSWDILSVLYEYVANKCEKIYSVQTNVLDK